MLILLSIMLVASGCGMINNVGQTVDFAAETSGYVQTLTAFGQDMNELAEQAANDMEARTELKQRLVALKEQVLQYGQLDAPDYARKLHESIAGYNKQLQQGLDQALTNIEQGRDAFAATGIPETVDKVNELLGELNGLAP
jgi:hypothetical protein